MERIIQLGIDNYSIITYRIKDDVMRNMQKYSKINNYDDKRNG
jgi:hypothetical protein